MKTQWKKCWRLARIIHNSQPQNTDALSNIDGLLWRAIMRRLDRDLPDSILATPLQNKIIIDIVDKILMK